MSYEDYWIEDETFIIRGKFYGLSTGLLGGWKKVNYAFNHTVKDEVLENPNSYVRSVARKFNLKNYFGLLTSVPMSKITIKHCEDVSVFSTVGINNPNSPIGTINIITVLDCRIPRSAMLNAIITITEAKAKALIESGHNFTGTSTDAVIILTTQKGRYYQYAGPASELGEKLWEATTECIKDGIKKW